MLRVEIAKPCDMTWTAMKGDETVRHCGACRKNVYNVSTMTEAKVEDLIRRTEGHFCARVYRRTDGRVLTADCPKGVARVRRRRTLAVIAALGAAVFALPMLTPTMGESRSDYRRALQRRREREKDEIVMGKLAVPPDIRMGEITVIPKRAR